MLGLILKDMYTILKEMKLFIAAIIVLSLFVRNDFLSGYMIFYAALFPTAAFGYDERAKWNKMADMLPVSTGQIVGTKYWIGFLSIFVSSIFAVSAKIITASGKAVALEVWAVIWIIVCVALLVQAVYLPIVFGIGVEKGRLCFILVIVVCSFASASLWSNIELLAVKPASNLIMAGGMLFAVFANWVSYCVSKRVYRYREQ